MSAPSLYDIVAERTGLPRRDAKQLCYQVALGIKQDPVVRDIIAKWVREQGNVSLPRAS